MTTVKVRPAGKVGPKRRAKPRRERLSWARRAGYVLFFLTLFVPTRYQSAKVVLLAIAVVAVLFQAVRGRLSLRSRFVLPVVFYVALGGAYVLYGVVRGNPGAWPSATVYVAWPLAYLFLALGITEPTHLRSLFRVMVAAGIAIGGYGCAYVLAKEGRLPGWVLSLPIDQGQIYYSPAPGQTTASFTSLSTLLFLLPFLITLLITWPKDRPRPVRAFWVFTAAALCLTLAALSARSALVLSFVVTPVVILLVARWSVRWIVPAVMSTLGLLVVVAGFHVRIGSVVSSVTNSFNASSDVSAQIRSTEIQALLTGFNSHPIFGAGLGAVAPDFIRDPQHPWAYELSYLALLFNVGIVGVALYGIGVAWASRRALQLRRDPVLGAYVAPVMVGFATFLIGDITNPYLAKFDSLWVLFFPLALLNVAAGRPQPATTPKARPARATPKARPRAPLPPPVSVDALEPAWQDALGIR